MEFNLYNIISLFGGLGMFLYGMHIMGDNLQNVAGAKLEKTLEKLTGNLIMGVLMGTAVTAVIQSSSATTVMVVGFVNAGIMNLRQAAGVIMGANIGTTITAQILRLDSLGGTGESLLNLLKPSSLAPLIIAVSVFLFMFMKKRKSKDIALIAFGFGLLFFGMDVMSSSMKPLADMPEFKEFLIIFKNPVFGIIAGMLITAIIQSSSASIGILQALAVTGAMPYSVAIPIILGQNIGTCVTALISAIGAKKNAKRAAFIHLYFNIIGTVIFTAAIYLINYIFKLPFWDNQVTSGGIANFHTIFNILNTLMFLPFTKLLVFLAEKTVKNVEEKDNFDDDDLQELDVLEERFLSSPSLAIKQCKKVVINMGTFALENLRMVKEFLFTHDKKDIKKIEENESYIDTMEGKLSSYMTQLTDVTDQDSKKMSEILHSTGDYERIGDYIENILEAAYEMKNKKLSFSDTAKSELNNMFSAVDEIIEISLKAYINKDVDAARSIEPLEEVIDMIKETLKKKHIKRLNQGECSIDTGIMFLEIINNLERVADHCSAIAVNVISTYNHENNFNKHEYLRRMHQGLNDDYLQNFDCYQKKYYNNIKI